MRAARGLIGLLLVAVIVSSCGGNVSPSASPTGLPSPTSPAMPSRSSGPPTAAATSSIAPTPQPVATSTAAVDGGEPSPQDQLAQALDARLGPNGEVDKQLALDMFAAVYGGAAELGATPIPGAVEGTTALMLTMEVWDQLTPGQQQVVRQNLDMPVSSSEMLNVTGQDGARPIALVGASDMGLNSDALMDSTDPTIQLVNNELAAVAALWGSRLPVPVRVDLMDTDLAPIGPGYGPPNADALPVQSDGVTPAMALDEYATCRVRIYPNFRRESPVDQVDTAAHELFHCFQYSVISFSDLDELRSGQLWIFEGQAAWVGASIAGLGGTTPTTWWRIWLTQPQKLWRRSYDAIGFYSSLARHRVDPWTVFRPMLLLPRSIAGTDFATMYSVATPGLTTDFLAQIAVDHASLASIGPPWLPDGPGAAAFPTAGPINVPTNTSIDRTIYVYPYDFDRLAFKVTDEVVTITSDTGPWALGGAGDAQVVSGPGSQTGCVQSACLCPDGAALNIPQLAINGRVAVGVTNAQINVSPLAIHLNVSSVPLSTACQTLPHRSPPPTAVPATDLGCMVGQWSLSSQTFSGDLIVAGLEGISYQGGIQGRHLEIGADGQYMMTDDGSDPSTGHGQSGGVPVSVRVTTTGEVKGTVERTSPTTATFASTHASIDLRVHEEVAGVPININHHYDNAAYFGNGDATVTCDGNSMTTAFPNASFTYTRS